ncbi:MAG: LysE family translocator [Coriobacteriales bacterium]|nr:LysE family translocator [Coriobacteriales bacterium]
MLSAQFLITSLVVVLLPGTGTLYTISTGVARGRRAGLAAAFGCTLGIVPHLLASALGLSAIMNLSAQVFGVVKLAGAAYLLFLAWQMWRETGSVDVDRDASERGMAQVAWRAIVLNLLNPKLTIFFLAFLPAFIEKGAGSAGQQLLGLSAVFMAMTFLVFAGYALIAGTARSVLSGPRAMRWMQRSFAVVFAGLAVDLALSER